MADSKVPTKGRRRRESRSTWTPAEIETTIVELEEEMLAAAEELRFEYAAKLARRDPRAATGVAGSDRAELTAYPGPSWRRSTRVPGAASPEARAFELDRSSGARRPVEIAGRWFGLRGRRFVRAAARTSAPRAGAAADRPARAQAVGRDDGQTWAPAFDLARGRRRGAGRGLEGRSRASVDVRFAARVDAAVKLCGRAARPCTAAANAHATSVNVAPTATARRA